MYRPGTYAQLAVGMLVTMLSFALQARVAPHRQRDDNFFAFLTSCSMQMVFAASMVLQAQALAPELDINVYLSLGILFSATIFVLMLAAHFFGAELINSREVLVLERVHYPPKVELPKAGTTASLPNCNQTGGSAAAQMA